MIRRALLSTSDKQGLEQLAQALHQAGVELLATGGTARHLEQHGIPYRNVADYIEFPEVLNGRVKTLHPKIHAGILAKREAADLEELATLHIDTIDLVVVNLYPFQQTIANNPDDLANAIEKIDIGGPTMLRAAAKNYSSVTVLSDPKDYPTFIAALAEQGDTELSWRRELAAKVFAQLSDYNQAIADYLAPQDELPDNLQLHWQKKTDLRYGENPQQRAALYQTSNTEMNLTQARCIQGKALSYNNYMDADAAYSSVMQLQSNTPACVIVKHATPCGVAIADTQLDAYQNALKTDPVSAFGGIIALNSKLESETAEAIMKQQFAEVIIAPEISDKAAALLSQKKNLRILLCPATELAPGLQFHAIDGGVLVQDNDVMTTERSNCEVVTTQQPSEQEWLDALFAWRVVKGVKSNAIVYAKDQATLGIGTGQTSRVFSAEIAALKAKQMELDLHGASLASDAFFPFADGVEIAAAAGIRCIIQPGGSKRDAEVIEAANRLGLSMIMTGRRHFRH